AVRTVPRPLRELVQGVVRGRDLVAVVRLSTVRVESPLLAPGGETLAHVCDDSVTAEVVGGDGTTSWREWEVELAGGDRRLLEAVGAALTRAGARLADSPSKLARALGDRLPPPSTATKPRRLEKAATSELLRVYLARHLARLVDQDRDVRLDASGAVHRMRISARRLRAALTTYAPFLEEGSVDEIRSDLRWLGQVLGEARDAQVLGERLRGLLATHRGVDIDGSAAARVDATFGAAYAAGRLTAVEALDSPRYFGLLDALDAFVADLPATPEADRAARKSVPRLLRRDTRRLRRAAKAVAKASDAETRDRNLHEVRKKAKRLRYAAESAVPLFGHRAKKLARRAKRVQEVLGAHQDSVVAREKLKELDAQAEQEGESGFTYGRLYALEEQAGEAVQAPYEAALDRIPHRVDRWVRR
ncbi:MAG: CHAD domain-containing protein, partial [Actinomycetota bacterium]|nr:CHAD domain-containing protein [Actinomycetota bacterium]